MNKMNHFRFYMIITFSLLSSCTGLEKSEYDNCVGWLQASKASIGHITTIDKKETNKVALIIENSSYQQKQVEEFGAEWGNDIFASKLYLFLAKNCSATNSDYDEIEATIINDGHKEVVFCRRENIQKAIALTSFSDKFLEYHISDSLNAASFLLYNYDDVNSQITLMPEGREKLNSTIQKLHSMTSYELLYWAYIPKYVQIEGEWMKAIRVIYRIQTNHKESAFLVISILDQAGQTQDKITEVYWSKTLPDSPPHKPDR